MVIQLSELRQRRSSSVNRQIRVFVVMDTSRMSAAVRPGTFWAAPVARDELVSGSSGRGVVLLHHAGRDAPAVADRDALVFGPRADVAAALAV
jgi:hypothetical protein